MFNRDHYGLTSNFTTSHIPSGVAPTRPALMKKQYLDEKRARLTAEAAERQHQKLDGFKQKVTSAKARLVTATFKAINAAKLTLSIVNRKA